MDCSLPGSSVHGTLRQEDWSGSPFPLPGDLPDPGIEPRIPALQWIHYPQSHHGSPLFPAVEALILENNGMEEQSSDPHLQIDETEKLTYFSNQLAFKVEMER